VAKRTLEKVNLENIKSSRDYLAALMGQKVALLCARYHYRGVVAAVLEDSVVLADAASVETSGASNRETPEVEDAECGSICIKLDAVEIIHQPRWVNAPLQSEGKK